MAETIREFLVGLGYKVDGSSEAKFARSITVATKGVVALGVAAVAASTAITAAVTKIAAGFDELYYASQRTKASAENIKAVGFAVSQLGGSYQGAVSSIEAFALKMRSNPGYESMARNLGVVTRENGKLKDTTVIMTDLARVLAKKPQYVTLQYLEALGIDEATYEALKSGDLVRYTEEYRKKQAALGVDQSRAAVIGKELTQAWRSLGATAAAVGDKLLQSLGPGIKDFVDRVDAFLIRNADKIVKFFEMAAEWVGKLLAAFVQLVEKGEGPLVEFFDKMVAGAQRMEKAFYALAAFLGGAFLLSVTTAFGAVASSFAAMLLKLGINPITLGIGAAAGAGYAINEGIDSHKDFHRRKDAIERPGGRNPFQAIDDADAKRFPKDTRTLWEKRPTWLGGKPDPRAPADRRTLYEKIAPKVIGGKDAPVAADPAALSRRSAGGGGRQNTLTAEQSAEMAKGIQAAAKEIGVSPDDIATTISYETGGTMHPWQKGPTTQWGTHRGLIQWGEPQARKYGVTAETSITDQMKAVAKYLRDRGVKPGDGLLQIYAAINAGHASKVNASDANNGGAPGTVTDKVRTMGGHRGALSRLERQGGVVPPTPSSLSFDASGFDATRNGGGVPAFDPSRLKRIQGNAAMGQGAFGIGGPVLVPPASNSTNVDMNQKTEITILGGGDPQATAREVASAQDKVNGGMLRNMAGAVR